MIAGLCHICGMPARFTCALCGRPVCERHLERGACDACRLGRR